MSTHGKIPAWVQDTVFYQIFPDRFANGSAKNDPANVQRWGSPPPQEDIMSDIIQDSSTPETTGRFIVTFREGAQSEALAALKKGAGADWSARMRPT